MLEFNYFRIYITYLDIVFEVVKTIMVANKGYETSCWGILWSENQKHTLVLWPHLDDVVNPSLRSVPN